MRNALSTLLFAGAILFSGCSGGGTDSSSSLRIRCLGGESFCIISCDLGCSQVGCAVTQIAENQALRFKFSDAVDKRTVNGSSISIRTATGVAPAGDFEVVGSEVVFRPRVSTLNGVSTFGFARNEQYIISLAGGASIAQSVTNLSGDGLSNEFTCTVVASEGILDQDGESPTVELVSPTDLVGAPVNPTIVLRFSELIDTTPLQVPLSEASPIRVVFRGRLPDGECDSDADGIALEGLPQISTEFVGSREVSVVTFLPTDLPGNSCLTVRVTADLRDLSGRSAVPAKFVILTEAGVPSPITIRETFANNAQQELQISGGTWGGAPSGARPARIGWDGRHGAFNATLGVAQPNGVFVWNVDNLVIPATSSATGLSYQVTDGRFFFTEMEIPENQTIRFVGSVPPVIHVRGRCDIRGKIEVNGVDAPSQLATSGLAQNQLVTTFATNQPANLTGQPGTFGGVGGGRGGAGGNRCLNSGPILVGGINVTAGQPGDDVRVRAGHAYGGSVGGTGGRGSQLSPTTGQWGIPTPTVGGTVYCAYFSPGGGGGGFRLAGSVADDPLYIGSGLGVVVPTSAVAGGIPFSLLPYPVVAPPANYSSLDHFTVGGSGGGGGGSHGYGIVALGNPAFRFLAGHGGTGGGGAVAIRSGGRMVIHPTAELSSRGGDGVLITGQIGHSSPGGGGSGGSFLLQSAQAVSVLGNINTRGGMGSRNNLSQNPSDRVQAQAGNGSTGFFRLEAPSVAHSGASVPAFVAGENSGPLTDTDPLSGDVSLWYSASALFPPQWQYYELDVDMDGDGTIDITYTDSGEPGTFKASEIDGPVNLPLVIRFQGANLNQAGTEPIEEPGPWRDGIGAAGGQGINLDAVGGFRFAITYNTALYPNLVVRELRVLALR